MSRKKGDSYKPDGCVICGETNNMSTRTLCRECYNARRRKRELDGYYWLYYLPKENYIGMSNNPARRFTQHNSVGKNIENARKIKKFKNPKVCAIVEAILHLWFKGSQYQTKY